MRSAPLAPHVVVLQSRQSRSRIKNLQLNCLQSSSWFISAVTLAPPWRHRGTVRSASMAHPSPARARRSATCAGRSIAHIAAVSSLWVARMKMSFLCSAPAPGVDPRPPRGPPIVQTVPPLLFNVQMAPSPGLYPLLLDWTTPYPLLFDWVYTVYQPPNLSGDGLIIIIIIIIIISSSTTYHHCQQAAARDGRTSRPVPQLPAPTAILTHRWQTKPSPFSPARPTTPTATYPARPTAPTAFHRD